jgi:aspartate racemase
MARSPHEELTAGVLGGLGPEATIDFMARVLRLTGARTDQENVHLLVDSNPKVPNRNAAIAGTGPSPAPALVAMARRLEAAGADFLVIVCNSAHAFATPVEAAVGIPLISIVEATCDELVRAHPEVVNAGILAADACLQAGLYQQALQRRGIAAVVPDTAQSERFMDLMYRIKAGDQSAAVSRGMADIAAALAQRGAQALLAACTEVPLVLRAEQSPVPLLNATEILAQRTVALAKRRLPLPSLDKPTGQ